MKVIILAGGSGTRLWPLSRERYPKQFIKLNSNKPSLFQETFLRSLLLTDQNNIYVVTNSKYKFLVMGAIEELGYNYNEANIIVEPEAKNTLPAIYAGVHEISKSGNDSIVVFPSDHSILKGLEFADIIKESEQLTNDSLITFGIKPNEPNIGYGYIAPGVEKLNGFEVKEFKEKPVFDIAVSYVNQGYLWNAGIFMFNNEFFINQVKNHSFNIYDAFESSNNIMEAFDKINEKISIDYGIMEKSKNVTVVPVEIGWSDLGSFDAIYDVYDKDLNNNITDADNILLDSKNNYIYSEKGKLVSMIGINNLIVVDNKDALLICQKDQSQRVKDIVNQLQIKNDKRTEYHVQDYRPWGSYTLLENGGSYLIKKLNIGVGKKLSYHVHNHRSEHWIILKGQAIVIIDNLEKNVYSGESLFIKPGQKHKLVNGGNVPLEMIEIQMGTCLEDDDDILRLNEDEN